MTSLIIQSQVTKTSQFLGAGVDISNVISGAGDAAADWALILEIVHLAPGDVVRFVFEDSTNYFQAYNIDIFSGPAISTEGAGNPDRIRFTIKKSDFPSLRFGVANAQLRLNLTTIVGTSKSVTYQSWVEY